MSVAEPTIKDAEATPSRVKKKAGKAWRIFRFLVRASTLLVLLLAGAFLFFWFKTISNPWTDSLLTSRWLTSTGLGLQFNKAEWSLSRGQLHIVAPTLIQADTGDNLLNFSAVEIKFGLGSVLRAIFTQDKDIEIPLLTAIGPANIPFEIRDGRIGLTEKLQQAYEILKAHLTAAKPEAEVLLGTISIEGVDLALDQVEQGHSEPQVRVVNAKIMAECFGASTPTSIIVVGEVSGREAATSFNLKLRPARDRDEIGLDVTILPFDSRKVLMRSPDFDFATGRVDAVGVIRRQIDGDWEFNSESKIASLTLFGAGVHGIDQHFEQGVLDANVAWSADAKVLKVSTAGFESRECSLKASGQIALEDPHRYSFRVDPLELRGQGLALAQRTVLGENYITKPDEGKMVFRGDVVGIPKGKTPKSILGDLSLSGLTVNLPDLSKPITNLRAEASLTTTTLTVKESYGVIQGIPLRIEGTLRGNMLAGEVEHAVLKWQTAGEMTGISDFLAQNSADGESDFSFSGKVSGSGTLKFDYPQLTDFRGMMERADSTGQLKFDGAEFRHRKLKEPIRGLSGGIDFDKKTAILKEVSGKIRDVDFVVNGKLSGAQSFLKETKAQVSLQANLKLQEVAEYCRWFDVEPPDLHSAEGRVQLKTNLSGPLGDWKSLRADGTATIQDFALRLDSEQAVGRISSPSMEVAFTPTSIRLQEAEALWDDVKIMVQGRLTPDAGEVTANINGSLTDLKRNLPKALEYVVEIGGAASIAHRSELHRKDAASRPAPTFNDLLVLMDEDKKNGGRGPEDQWDIKSSGDMRLSDAMVLSVNMPESARVTRILGEAKYNDDGLWTEKPVMLKPGEHSEMAQVMARIMFQKGPATMALLDFEGTGNSLDLNDWIKDWPSTDDGTPPAAPSGSPFDPNATPLLRIKVKALTKLATYRGVHGQNLNGNFLFEFYGHDRIKLAWSDVKADVKEGSIFTGASIIKQDGREVDDWRFAITKMDVTELLKAAMGENNKSGLTRGQITGSIELHSDGGDDSPFTGGGHLLVENAMFKSNSIFRLIGRLLGLEVLFNEITFTRIEGPFRIAEGRVIIDEKNPMMFENPSKLHPLNINTVGTIERGRQLKMLMSLQLFPVVGEIPLIGTIWRTLTGRILRYSVSGTLDDPDVSVAVPLIPNSAENPK